MGPSNRTIPARWPDQGKGGDACLLEEEGTTQGTKMEKAATGQSLEAGGCLVYAPSELPGVDEGGPGRGMQRGGRQKCPCCSPRQPVAFPRPHYAARAFAAPAFSGHSACAPCSPGISRRDCYPRGWTEPLPCEGPSATPISGWASRLGGCSAGCPHVRCFSPVGFPTCTCAFFPFLMLSLARQLTYSAIFYMFEA